MDVKVKLDEKLNEYGIFLEQNQYDTLYKFLINYSINDDFDIDCSSGRSLVINPRLSTCVYQFYLNQYNFECIVNNLKLINSSPVFVNVLGVLYNYSIIIYEKIRPIYNIKTRCISLYTNLDKFYNDICYILYILKLKSLSHGDFTCDNIGYSLLRKRYVLYDLETIKKTTNCSDIYSINKSLLFHGIVFSH